ncbi:hypothetical protein M0Q28_01460 [Patescibacteria group bacterium]|jgi:hypothetical protein|nr:hypothetical protein [Patescibacteria group bacterium]
MTGPPHKTPTHRTGTNLKLDDLLRGEAFGIFPTSAKPVAIDEMMKAASVRFGPKGLFSIGVSNEVEIIQPEARERIRKGFEHFRDAGGIQVLVFCTKPTAATAFIRVASEVGILLTIVRTSEEQTKLQKEFRDKYHPKPKT